MKINMLLIILLMSLSSVSANAATSIHNDIQRAVNQLGELESYVSRWTTYVSNELSAHPAADTSEINLPNANTGGATFSSISVNQGKVVIQLNSILGLVSIDGAKIILTPVTADTNGDGNQDTVISWSCQSSITNMSAWGRSYNVLNYLAWPLSDCSINASL